MLEFLAAYVPLLGLLIFGNIENLVLASQGVVAGVKPKRLGLLSILFVDFLMTRTSPFVPPLFSAYQIFFKYGLILPIKISFYLY